MDAKRFKHLWSNPAEVRDEDLSELRNICLNNPFFAAGQMLYTKALHDRADYHFNKQLKWAALYCPNRELLHDYVHGAQKISEKPVLDFDPHEAVITEEVASPEVETPVKEELETPEISKELIEEVPPSKDTPSVSEMPVQEEAPVEVPAVEEPEPEVEPVKEMKPEPVVEEKTDISQEASSPVAKKSSGGNEEWADRIAALRKKSEEVIGKISQNLEENKPKQKEVIPEEVPSEEPPSEEVEINEKLDDFDESSKKETFTSTDEIEPDTEPKKQDDQDQPLLADEKLDSVQAEIPGQVEQEEEVDFVLDLTDIQQEKVSLPEEPSTQEEIPQVEDKVETEEESSPLAKAQTEELPETSSQPTSSGDFFAWLRSRSLSDETKATNEEKPDDTGSSVSQEAKEEEVLPPSSEKIIENRKKIDAFLDKLPEIVGPKKVKHDDFRLSPVAFSTGIEEDSDLVTETLARIYIEQGHVDKAIKAYEILMLKMPEKSSLFARQIQSLKKQNKK
jgi:hypothetical protein